MPKFSHPIIDPPDPQSLEGTPFSTKSARAIVKRAPHRTVGIVACAWIQEHGIQYESQLERRFIQKSILFPHLLRVFHQPFKIDFEDQGKNKSYTPDFLLQFKDKSWVVVEVKPHSKVGEHSWKFDAAKSYLEKHGIPFIVITDKEIDVATTPANAALILRYARGSMDALRLQECIRLLQSNDDTQTFESIQTNFKLRQDELFYLIGRGHFSIAPDLQLNPNSSVTLTKYGTQNATILFFNWFNATPWQAVTRISSPASGQPSPI